MSARAATRCVRIACASVFLASAASAQQPTVMFGASFGAGFSRGVDNDGLTGSIAGSVSMRGSAWVLSSNALEFLLLPRDEGLDPFASGPDSQCRDVEGRQLINARCSGVSTRAIYSPTIEIGRATQTRLPVVLTAGYRFGALGGTMGALALLSGQQDRSHSFLRIAGGRNHIVLSMGVNVGRFAGAWLAP